MHEILPQLNQVYMGISLNGGTSTPHFTPQVLIIFSLVNPWLLGKPTILGLGNPYMVCLTSNLQLLKLCRHMQIYMYVYQ